MSRFIYSLPPVFCLLSSFRVKFWCCWNPNLPRTPTLYYYHGDPTKSLFRAPRAKYDDNLNLGACQRTVQSEGLIQIFGPSRTLCLLCLREPTHYWSFLFGRLQRTTMHPSARWYVLIWILWRKQVFCNSQMINCIVTLHGDVGGRSQLQSSGRNSVSCSKGSSASWLLDFRGGGLNPLISPGHCTILLLIPCPSLSLSKMSFHAWLS